MKIAYYPVDAEATGWHRVIGPLECLRDTYPSIEIELLNCNLIPDGIDVAFLQCLIGPQQKSLIERLKTKKIKIVIDYDDNFAEIPENIIERFGLSQEEITANWVWYLKNADIVTVPTKTLAEKCRKYSGKYRSIRVLPNYINKNLYESSITYRPYEDIHREVRILYSASDSHLADLQWVYPVFEQVVKNKPVRVLVQGPFYSGEKFNHKIEYINKCPYSRYIEHLKSYRPHIFIAPLKPNNHSICRSNLKYLQSALLKCAFVGSNLPPYARVSHGRTGLLPEYRWTWTRNIENLVNNPALTIGLAEAAFLDAKYYLLDDNINAWYDIFSELDERNT